jgi:hypothetical protein
MTPLLQIVDSISATAWMRSTRRALGSMAGLERDNGGRKMCRKKNVPQ